jgi:hypothetical protein
MAKLKTSTYKILERWWYPCLSNEKNKHKKRKINAREEGKNGVERKKWDETFVISHFFLGNLNKSFFSFDKYILCRSELNLFSILAFQIGVIHFYNHLPPSTFSGWTTPLRKLWIEVMLALLLVKRSTKNVFWCAEVYWLMTCRMSRNWPNSEGNNLLLQQLTGVKYITNPTPDIISCTLIGAEIRMTITWATQMESVTDQRPKK